MLWRLYLDLVSIDIEILFRDVEIDYLNQRGGVELKKCLYKILLILLHHDYFRNLFK